jgi:SAM-dependent methyltransferase
VYRWGVTPPRSAPVVHPFDRKFGTETSGLIAGHVIARGTGAKVEELTAYYGIAPSILHGLLDVWLTRTEPEAEIEHTVFLDVGAGKGRAMLVASQYPFQRVEGIELSPKLARITEANIAKFEQHPENDELSPLMLIEGDATQHLLPAGPCLAFLFHPFELPVLKRFIAHVERTLKEHPHPFDLLYANTEHDLWLDKHPAFERVWFGKVPMSSEDHLADLAEIAQQQEYGSTGDELCAIYRYIGRGEGPAMAKKTPIKKAPARKSAARKSSPRSKS